MENKSCTIRGCSENPEYVCYCEEKPVLICQTHKESHSKLEKNHKYSEIFSKIDEKTRKSAFQLFFSVKSEIKSIRSKILNEDLCLIKQLNKAVQKALFELKNYEKIINQTLLHISSLKIIDNSKDLDFAKYLLKMPFNYISEIKKIQSPNLYINRLKIENFSEMFEFIFPDQKADYYESFKASTNCIKFMISGTKILSIFNPENRKVAKVNILLKSNYKLDQYGAKCILPDGNLFYCNGDVSIIIDQIGNSHNIGKYKPSLNACSVYIDEWVYLFGGVHNNSEKYSITDYRWVSLKPAPFADANYANCTLFKKYILLTSSNSEKTFYYDTILDSYSEISSLYSYQLYKAFVVNGDTVFFFQFNTYIFESNDNLISWNKVGRCSILSEPLISYSINYEGKAYLVNNDGIYSFDFARKTVVKVLDYR